MTKNIKGLVYAEEIIIQQLKTGKDERSTFNKAVIFPSAAQRHAKARSCSSHKNHQQWTTQTHKAQ